MLYLYSVFMHFLLNLSYLLFRMGQLYCFNWSPTSFDSTIITRLQGIWKNVILSSWKTSSKRYIWTFLSIPIVCLKILPNGLYMKNTFNIKKKKTVGELTLSVTFVFYLQALTRTAWLQRRDHTAIHAHWWDDEEHHSWMLHNSNLHVIFVHV